MTDPLAHVPPRTPTARTPVRGGPWPAEPVYDRGAAGQAAFEQAVARLWDSDSWRNPRTGQWELNADLVLDGGGVKGIGLAGAILVLAEAGYHFPRVAGTSAGTIAAVLVAAIEKSGQDMRVLKDYLGEIDYPKFLRPGPARHAVERAGGRRARAVEPIFGSGLWSGDYLTIWLGGKLKLCGVSTWHDLAISEADDPQMSLPDGRRYRAVVHVRDITRGMLARLPWDYRNYYGLRPEAQDVASSVRASMSMSIPFVAPVRTPTKAARTKMPDGSTAYWPGGMVTWVDGGMLRNLPLDSFDRADGARPRWPTIGIKLPAEAPAAPGSVPATRVPASGTAGTLAGNAAGDGYHGMRTMSEWDRYHVQRDTADRTIFVDNDLIAAAQPILTASSQETLLVNGAKAATDFLIRWAAAGGVPRSTPPGAAADGRPAQL